MQKKDNLYKRLISDTAIIGIGTLGSKVLMYLLVRFYTEVLTRQEYSVASNITETATLLIPFVSLGIGEAVFRFAVGEEFGKSRALTNGLAVFAFGALLLSVIAPIINSIEYFSGYGLVIAVYVLSSVFHTILSQFLRSQRMFKLYALQGVINTLLTVGFNMLFLIPLNMGITGYVLAVAAADFLSSTFIFVAARVWRYIDIKKLSFSSMKPMLLFALPLIPTTVAWWITNVSDRYMVTYFKGDYANGAYAVAYKIPTLLTVLVGVFNNAWKYSAVDVKDSDREKDFVSDVSGAFISVMFTASAFIIIMSKPIAKIMFANDFYSAWVYIPILTLAMLFSSFASFCGTVFISHKKSVYSLVTSVIPAVLNILLNLLLIPRFGVEIGAMGAAIATFISYFVMYILKAAASKRLLDYNLYTLRVAVNTAVITAIALTVTFEIKLWIFAALAGFALILLINAKPLLKAAKKVLKK